MMCYLDTTFCVSPQCQNKCGRKLTQQIQLGAKRWWSHDPDNAPIAVSEFCDNNGDLIKYKEGN